jgi:hypothetical protein
LFPGVVSATFTGSERSIAQILEAVFHLVSHIVARRSGHANAAGLRQGFDARRDIDALAIELAVFQHHVADIDADAEFHARLGREFQIGRIQGPLDRDKNRPIARQPGRSCPD